VKEEECWNDFTKEKTADFGPPLVFAANKSDA